MQYVVEIFFSNGRCHSRLFGTFRSAEQAQTWAMAMVLQVESAMDFAIRPLETIA